MLDEWPALRKWSVEFFQQRYAAVKVLTMPVRNQLIRADTERGSASDSMSLGECLERVANPVHEDRVTVTTWFNGLPSSLAGDIQVPEYCADAVWRRSRLWITPASTLSPMHQDLYENLYGLVCGAKRFYLYPPRPRSVMHPYSVLSRAPNLSPVNPEEVDFERFPRFRQARAVIADLRPGDILFLPSLWWHFAATPETSIAVNFWWARGWKLPLAWLASTYREWRGI